MLDDVASDCIGLSADIGPSQEDAAALLALSQVCIIAKQRSCDLLIYCLPAYYIREPKLAVSPVVFFLHFSGKESLEINGSGILQAGFVCPLTLSRTLPTDSVKLLKERLSTDQVLSFFHPLPE